MKLTHRATWHTFAMVTMLTAMWYAAEAQSNGAAYLLALLAGLLTVISVLHARANLRGLRMRVRAVSTVKEGGKCRVRAEVVNDAAKVACGIEVQVVGAEQGVFIDQLAAGQSKIIELAAPARHGSAGIRLLARSAYPLGLFSTETVIETAAVRRVHPRAAGKLPLPAAQPLGASTQLHSSGRGAMKATRGGDDFAGTREFQQGDSPRHIDWRAVARGRPLVVKTWASSATGVVVLNWNAMPLAEDERAAQVARWIDDCERDEKPYALHLPRQAAIGAGLGEGHARRCLDALADFTAQTTALGVGGLSGQKAGKARVAASFENSAHLPAGPLFMLSIALLAALLPLAEFVALPCIGASLVCMLYRAFFRRDVPSLLIRLIALFGGLGMVLILYNGQRSMEAGIALLVTLLGVKLLESRTPREFQVLALIGWFLCLCTIILDNSLPRTLWCLGAFMLITACMVRFRLSLAGLWRPFRFTGVLFLQALPLVVLLFMLLPRGVLNLSALLNSRLGQSGINSELDPGSITQMAMRLDKAFRVEFPDGVVPTNELRYWRCLTLTECRGFSWRKGRPTERKFHSHKIEKGVDVAQRVILEPNGARWMPALDVPFLAELSGAQNYPQSDDTLTFEAEIRGLMRYTAWSRPLQRDFALITDRERRDALQVPKDLPPRVRQLALTWKNQSKTDLETVQRGILHLQQNGFKYTLTPDEYSGPLALDQFLFEGRNGFCEHFAASFATLMRVAGVPARVVIGYLGGEYSDKTQQMIVRQSDAHAWMEVWLDKQGWTRLDPTAALAPGRVSNPFRNYLSSGVGSGVLGNMSTWSRALFETRLLWDRVNFAWQESVVEYNQETQESWLTRSGRAWQPWHLALLSLALLLGSLLGIYRWLRRGVRPADPWARAWLKLCDKLRRAGLSPRLPGEGPLDYAQRIGSESVDITPLAEIYARGRYGVEKGDLTSFQRAIRLLRVR